MIFLMNVIASDKWLKKKFRSCVNDISLPTVFTYIYITTWNVLLHIDNKGDYFTSLWNQVELPVHSPVNLVWYYFVSEWKLLTQWKTWPTHYNKPEEEFGFITIDNRIFEFQELRHVQRLNGKRYFLLFWIIALTLLLTVLCCICPRAYQIFWGIPCPVTVRKPNMDWRIGGHVVYQVCYVTLRYCELLSLNFAHSCLFISGILLSNSAEREVTS
jgi:hypothetical protein